MWATPRRLIQYVGKVLPSHVGHHDPTFRAALEAHIKNKENTYSEVKKAKIRGSEPHGSYDDPSDNKAVVSVQFFDANDKRLGTDHVHSDYTVKEGWPANKKGVESKIPTA